METFTKEYLVKVLLEVLAEKQDFTDYDFDDNLLIDEEYYCWHAAIETVAARLGIDLDGGEEDDF